MSDEEATAGNESRPAVLAPVEQSVRPLAEGDVVRLKDTSRYIVSFATKAADRHAVVLWVGPRANGMFKGRAKVRFLKRNGRGKEFEEVLRTEDLVLQPNAELTCRPGKPGLSGRTTG